MRYLLATRYNDYDTKGHVNNAVYLTFFEMARHQLWTDGFGESGDFPFIVAEAQVRFVSPAHIDVPLAIEIVLGEVRTKAWVWRYRVVDAGSDRLIAEGQTVQVMYDYAAGASVPIPDAIRAKLERT
jgi:acyl-CoA thioester hydrolase